MASIETTSDEMLTRKALYLQLSCDEQRTDIVLADDCLVVQGLDPRSVWKITWWQCYASLTLRPDSSLTLQVFFCFCGPFSKLK